MKVKNLIDIKNIRQRGEMDTGILIAIGVLLFSVGASYIYFSLFGNPKLSNLKTLQGTMTAASNVNRYTADIYIQPHGMASSSSIIIGKVSFDEVDDSTMGTFTFPTSQQEVKTFSFGTESYVKITDSNASGAYPDSYIQMKNTDIGPNEYELLKKTFALTDIIRIFKDGGAYLMIDGEPERILGGIHPEIHYVLRASKAESLRPEKISESEDSLLKTGDINVWIISKDKMPEQVRFSTNGYMVTIKFKDINKKVEIKKPTNITPLVEWNKQQFVVFAPKEVVSEIFIGSYGAVKKEYLDGIRLAVEKATGIKPTVLISGPALPQKPPLYNEVRHQLDAVPVFEGVKKASLKYGDKARFIYVIDTDIYSSLQKDLPKIWSLETRGVNTSLISISGLQNISDTDPKPASAALVISRAQKVALMSLGTSVGFDLSSSSNDPSCLMSKTTSLAVLDKQLSGYCAEENTVLNRFFGK